MDHCLMLYLLLVLLLTVPTEGSYCMSTDCTGSCQESIGLPPQYLRVCCATSNLGESVTMRQSDNNVYILCPKEQPKRCPAGIAVIRRYIVNVLFLL